MLRSALFIFTLLTSQACVTARAQTNPNGAPVEVVATASEYVPQTTTVSHPGHAYTDCHGSTTYLGDFHYQGFDDLGYISGRGDISGTAETNTRCSTTFTPPSESTLTTYRRVNYTVVQRNQTLYLLSCTQVWQPSKKVGLLFALTTGGSSENAKKAADARGRWSDCPAFGIGDRYNLTIRSSSDAQLENATVRKPAKLDFLSSAALPVASTQPQSVPTAKPQVASLPAEAKVHFTSTPSGAEIYVDGKFYGTTPSDITLPAGERSVTIKVGGKEWTRTVQITAGEIRVHAEI